MDRRVTWVGSVLLLCFMLLFVQMNNLQIRQAAALNGNSLNRRIIVTPSPFFEPRGEILSADGFVLAYSKPSHDQYKYIRLYSLPTAKMFSDITGYDDNALAAAPIGVEGSYNYLLQEHETSGKSLGQLLDQHAETDNVYLTISEKVQAVAMQSLDASPGKNGGAIVAIDPRTGAILAMYGYPAYNPNSLSSHDVAKVNALYAKVSARDGGTCAAAPEAGSGNVQLNPLCNFAMEETNAPGSTMKVITSSAVYDHDPSVERQTFKPVGSIVYPNCTGTGCTIQNYNKEICPPAPSVGLAQILASSCDTAYAQIGDELGYDRLAEEARAFGFGQIPPIDLPRAQSSAFPTAAEVGNSTAYEGQEAIGQYDDSATVLQMALVAAAIGNNGTIMTPHVVSRAVDGYGETAFTYHPHVWLHATSTTTADQVRQFMTGVTGATHLQHTTAGELFSGWYANGGPVIAAKTGTAEPGGNTCGTYNWLIALGPAAQGQVPTVAVAAMIPVSEAQCAAVGYSPTGASVAGPVLLPVLQAALAEQGS